MYKITLPLLLVCICAWGCSSDDSQTPLADDITSPDTQDTQSDTYSYPDPFNDYPGCHIDCFGGAACYDGIIYVYRHSPIPCSDQSRCVQQTLPCPLGCREQPSHGYDETSWQDTFCKIPTPFEGSPCDGDFQCVLENLNYLRCDTTQQQCVSVKPSPPSDYLQTCKLSVPLPNQRFVETDACIGGVCIIAQDTSDPDALPCKQALQGCSMFCDNDLACPDGSLCVPMYGQDRNPVFICKPGPLDQWSDIGLSNSCE